MLRLVEVGPRDGFQSVCGMIPTETKIEIINKTIDAGVKDIQICSFVSPKALPQMADAAEVASAIVGRVPDVSCSALVPNLRGALNAEAAGLNRVVGVISLSESHNQANVRMSREQSCEALEKIIAELPGLSVSVSIATAFGCPYEGEMKLASLLSLIGSLADIGVKDLTLCDTIGIAHPSQVKEFVRACKAEYPNISLGIHIHDTRNMGMLNSYVAIEEGADAIEAALGGLGGCPFAAGASGNTSSEDLVYMLTAEGIETGIDSQKLIEAAKFLKEKVPDGVYSGHLVNV